MTASILAGVTVALIAYDVWTGVKRGRDTTISMVIWKSSLKYPFIPFAFGMLMGHLFTQMGG